MSLKFRLMLDEQNALIDENKVTTLNKTITFSI